LELRHIIPLYCLSKLLRWRHCLLPMSHNFATVALPCLRWSVTSETLIPASFISFGIREGSNFAICRIFSRHIPFPCQCPLTNVTHSHILTTSTPHNLTKIRWCHLLKYLFVYSSIISTKNSQVFGILFTEIFGFLSGFDFCT